MKKWRILCIRNSPRHRRRTPQLMNVAGYEDLRSKPVLTWVREITYTKTHEEKALIVLRSLKQASLTRRNVEDGSAYEIQRSPHGSWFVVVWQCSRTWD